MRTFAHIITDRQGLHARSCVIIAREASKWSSDISMSDAQREADAKSLASLLALRGVSGDELIVRVEGTDEDEASYALEALMRMSI